MCWREIYLNLEIEGNREHRTEKNWLRNESEKTSEVFSVGWLSNAADGARFSLCVHAVFVMSMVVELKTWSDRNRQKIEEKKSAKNRGLKKYWNNLALREFSFSIFFISILLGEYTRAVADSVECWWCARWLLSFSELICDEIYVFYGECIPSQRMKIHNEEQRQVNLVELFCRDLKTLHCREGKSQIIKSVNINGLWLWFLSVFFFVDPIKLWVYSTLEFPCHGFGVVRLSFYLSHSTSNVSFSAWSTRSVHKSTVEWLLKPTKQ